METIPMDVFEHNNNRYLRFGIIGFNLTFGTVKCVLPFLVINLFVGVVIV